MKNPSPPPSNVPDFIATPEALHAALARGERELWLPFGAVGTLGAGYIAAMIAQAKAQFPGVEFVLWADCGHDAALVMAALQEGLTHLSVRLDKPVFMKLADMAEQAGARLIVTPTP